MRPMPAVTAPPRRSASTPCAPARPPIHSTAAAGRPSTSLKAALRRGPGGHDVDREVGEVSDDAEAVGGVGVAQMRLPDLVEEVHGGEEDEVAGDEAEQHQGRAQDQAGQEQPALAGGLGGEGVAVAAGDVGGGERGDGEDGGDDIDDPGEDGEQEAEEGDGRQEVGEDSAGDEEDAEDGGDEAVGDLPSVSEQVEAPADEGDGPEAAGDGRGGGEGADGGHGVEQEVVAVSGEIGDRVAAVGEGGGVDRQPVPQPGADAAVSARRGQRAAAEQNGLPAAVWARATVSACTAAAAGFEAPSRLPAGSAASGRFQADVWNDPCGGRRC